ncbi:MAG: 4Fe-4S dicluster domain-containing protein [Betaproteobacteria bacterium]
MGKDQELLERIANYLGLSAETTRRGFLKATVGTAVGLSVVGALARKAGSTPFVILESAEGIIVADTTRCTGCKRCELACTEFNDGKSQPSLARIKVSRNYNFGPRGQQAGFNRSMGEFGNFRLVQDTCKQCPHPVPCATACPNDAIVVDPKTKARVVDQQKCKGCKLCQKACPWEMMVFDQEAGKASKCFLCGGKPQCVEACPCNALQYVSWRDLTGAVPIRQAAPATRDYKSAGCDTCH